MTLGTLEPRSKTVDITHSKDGQGDGNNLAQLKKKRLTKRCHAYGGVYGCEELFLPFINLASNGRLFLGL